MAEALASRRRKLVSAHENNISMLLDKLKEFRMGADTAPLRNIYSKVESKYQLLLLMKLANILMYVNYDYYHIK